MQSETTAAALPAQATAGLTSDVIQAQAAMLIHHQQHMEPSLGKTKIANDDGHIIARDILFFTCAKHIQLYSSQLHLNKHLSLSKLVARQPPPATASTITHQQPPLTNHFSAQRCSHEGAVHDQRCGVINCAMSGSASHGVISKHGRQPECTHSAIGMMRVFQNCLWQFQQPPSSALLWRTSKLEGPTTQKWLTMLSSTSSKLVNYLILHHLQANIKCYSCI
jgi:hypothetical protein